MQDTPVVLEWKKQSAIMVMFNMFCSKVSSSLRFQLKTNVADVIYIAINIRFIQFTYTVS